MRMVHCIAPPTSALLPSCPSPVMGLVVLHHCHCPSARDSYCIVPISCAPVPGCAVSHPSPAGLWAQLASVNQCWVGHCHGVAVCSCICRCCMHCRDTAWLSMQVLRPQAVQGSVAFHKVWVQTADCSPSYCFCPSLAHYSWPWTAHALLISAHWTQTRPWHVGRAGT